MKTAKKLMTMLSIVFLLTAITFIPGAPAAPTASAAETNLALNRPITSTSISHAPKDANDGNQNSYFESAYTLPQSLTVDLGSAYPIGRIVLKEPAAWTDRTLTLTIQGSMDNATFTDLKASAAYAFSTTTGNTVTVPMSGATAKYVRLLFTGNTSRTSAQLGELEIYADKANSPDFVVTDIDWTPANPVEGEAVTFSTVVKNVGQAASPAGIGHSAAFRIDGVPVAATGTYTASIAPGASATLTATGTWTAAPYKFDVQAVANAGGTVGEADALNNDDYTEELAVRETGWRNQFNIKEQLGIYAFPEELISYPLDFTGFNVKPDHIRLRQFGGTGTIPYQLSDVVLDGSGFLTRANIHFRTGLNLGETKRFTVDTDPAYTPSFPSQVTVTNNGDGTAWISANHQQVKVPHGTLNLNGIPLSEAPAPILAMSRQSGTPIGSGSFVAPASITVSSVFGRVVEQGQLFVKYKITYTVSGGRTYDTELIVRHDEKYVTVDETYAGFVSTDNAFLKFSYKNGVDPNGRIAIQNGGYIRTTAGGRSGGYGDGADPTGKLPYEVGIYAVNSNNLNRSTSFWNDTGDNAILFASYRLKDWKTETRQIYNAYIKQNLRFYNTESDKYMQAGLEGTERHWALSIIPRSEEVLSGKRMSDNTKPADVLIDSVWTNIPTATSQQPGTAPDVKLWQKLADFSLNGYKEMVFEFPEDANRKLPLPGYNNVSVASPEDYWTDKYCFACFKKYNYLTDKYWDISGELGPSGTFGRGERYFFSDYAYNRENWGLDERKRTRSLFIFLVYTAADDNNLPHISMLGGHPNFNMDVKQVLALAAGTFPQHPHASTWKAAYVQDFNEVLTSFTRKDNAAAHTTGGRWYENLPTYTNASLSGMLAAQASLLQYDNTDIFANPTFKTFAKWILNALTMNERATFRSPVPIGAHASGGDPGGEFDGIYRLLADQVLLSDPDLGGKLLWSATNGAQGINPGLKSTLFTDYGPVFRYDFGGPNEAFLYLQQLTGPGYRWSPTTNGSLYYAVRGKRYSWNGGEENGDLIDMTKLPLFLVGDKSLGDSKPNGVLYDFGPVQYYKAMANGGNAPYLSRGVMMVRDQFIGVYDDMNDNVTDGAFQWFNRETGLTAEYYNNIDFTDLRATGLDNSRFPGTSGTFGWQNNVPSNALDPDTYSVVWSGKIAAKYTQPYTYSATTGTGDSVKILVGGALAFDSATNVSTPVAMVAGQLTDITIRYTHGTGTASLQWRWSSASQPNGNVEGLFFLSRELPQSPNVYTAKEGPGDEFHLVSPDALTVSNETFGAKVGSNQYVFASDTVQNITGSGAVEFVGKVGYAEPGRIALFDGTKVRYDDLALELSGGSFGASAETAGPSLVQGRIAGTSGGTVTVTLPASFTASNALVKIEGVDVPSTKTGSKVVFTAAIAQSDGVKSYTIEPGTPPTQTTLLSDDFQDGDAAGWTVTAGTWSVVADGGSGTALVYRTTNGATTAGDGAWSNYTAKAKVRLTGTGAATVELLGRYTNGNNFYYFQLDSGANRLKLYKKTAGTITLLKSVPFTVTPFQWYELQLGFSGASLTGTVDGNSLIVVTDSSLAAGKIGLRASAEANFDDLIVQ